MQKKELIILMKKFSLIFLFSFVLFSCSTTKGMIDSTSTVNADKLNSKNTIRIETLSQNMVYIQEIDESLKEYVSTSESLIDELTEAIEREKQGAFKQGIETAKKELEKEGYIIVKADNFEKAGYVIVKKEDLIKAGVWEGK